MNYSLSYKHHIGKFTYIQYDCDDYDSQQTVIHFNIIFQNKTTNISWHLNLFAITLKAITKPLEMLKILGNSKSSNIYLVTIHQNYVVFNSFLT